MSIDRAIASGLDTDLADLRAVLARHPFPTHQDDVLALLVARHEPARLLWRAAALAAPGSTARSTRCATEIAQSTGTRMPPPPGR